MDFAPYQSEPEASRTRSPTRSPRQSLGNRPQSPILPLHNSPPPQNPAWRSDGREFVNQFETSLPIRLDYEAMMAYLLLPPVGGVLLLILEHKSDYVRFHAWQSALLFTALAIVHFILSFSSFLSWLLFIVDLGLIAYLSYHAYKDADTLDRCEIPFFGPLASSILDDE